MKLWSEVRKVLFKIQGTMQTFSFLFSRAVSTSGATYLVTMACVRPYVRLYLTEGPLPPTPEIIRSQKFLNQNLFQLILSNFFGGTPPPQVKGKIFDTGFGLIHVQTGKKNFFKKIF